LIRLFLEDVVQKNSYEPGHYTPVLKLSDGKQEVLLNLLWLTANQLDS
jgi:hypothetical protein